jgi:hypothetical protein
MLRPVCNDIIAASEVQSLGFGTVAGSESGIEIPTDSPVLAAGIEP